MPWNDDSVIRSLRLAYNAALDAHSARYRALTETVMRGELPSPTLVGAEAVAKARMIEARAKLHAAMAAAMNGKPPDFLTG
jgi:hypothetical protein